VNDPGKRSQRLQAPPVSARNQLDPQIGWRGAWDRAAEAADALFDRRVPGKAVLDLRK
jgi:hypothetical protein